MKKQILLFAFLGVLGCARAQGTSAGICDRPYIEVTGTHEMEITPDEIYIHISLREQMEKKEKTDIRKQEDSLKFCLKQLGIELSNLTVNRADADYGRVRKSAKDVFLSKTYTLKLNNADLLNKLYKAFDRIDVADAYVERVDHSKIEELTKECRIKAIKAAKDKVDYLLAAVGKTAAGPLSISDSGSQVIMQEQGAGAGAGIYGRMRFLDKAMVSNSAYTEYSDSNNEQELTISKIKIVANIWVKYEIKQ